MAGVTAAHEAAGGGAARKGGTPGEGSPFNPFLRFVSIGAFRALRRAAKGSAPGPRPLFCKKAGQKTFTGPDFRRPKPLAPGASDQIRPRSGHLSCPTRAPKARGRGGWDPPAFVRRYQPKRLSLGLHPVSLGKTKEMGWNWQHKVKFSRAKRRVPPTPTPTPAPEKSEDAAKMAASSRVFRGTAACRALIRACSCP